jgi:ADP-ribose pyrophosphatase YjhB (NUDIX family)
VTDRVRALLVTPDGDFLVFRRVRPGVEHPYWILPGGGVDDGETLAEALERELREEIAGVADVHGLLYIFEGEFDRHYIYLARVRSWSDRAADRSGPEFSEPDVGEHLLQKLPLTVESVEQIDLKPEAFAEFLLSQLRAGADLFALPDAATNRLTS